MGACELEGSQGVKRKFVPSCLTREGWKENNAHASPSSSTLSMHNTDLLEEKMKRSLAFTHRPAAGQRRRSLRGERVADVYVVYTFAPTIRSTLQNQASEEKSTLTRHRNACSGTVIHDSKSKRKNSQQKKLVVSFARRRRVLNLWLSFKKLANTRFAFSWK